MSLCLKDVVILPTSYFSIRCCGINFLLGLLNITAEASDVQIQFVGSDPFHIRFFIRAGS